MAEEAKRVYPQSNNKWPTPFSNLLSAYPYPKWEPVDTKKKTMQVFKLGFYSTVGAYGWLYIWKRTTFKIGLPLVITGFATVTVAVKGMIANLRETNDGWNTFWAVTAGNVATLTIAFKHIPVKHKVMGGLAGAALSALSEQLLWAQSTSSAGQDFKFAPANTEDLPEQGFWDVWKRRPLSQTANALGSGRGFLEN